MSNKPLSHDVRCEQCGKQFTLSDNTFRRYKKQSIPCLCLPCRNKKWRENLSDEERERLRKQNSEAQKKAWKNKSDEQRTAGIKQLRAVNDEFRSNVTKEQRKEINKKISKKISAYLANMDEDKFSERMQNLENKFRAWWGGLTDEEYKNICKQRSDYYNSLSKEEKDLYRVRSINAWNNMPDEEKAAISEREKLRWINKSDEEKLAVAERERNHWLSLPEEYRNERLKYMAAKSLEWRNNLTDEERLSMSEKMSDIGRKHWVNMSERERVIHSSNAHKGKHQGAFNDLFDAWFSTNIQPAGFYNIKEYSLANGNIVHSWDYGIFDENGELVMVVDLDGAYYHADICDYNGMHSHRRYDINRGYTIPDGVKWCIIQELKSSECLEWLGKIIQMPYDKFIQETFRHLRAMPMPVPTYSARQLSKSFRDLSLINRSAWYRDRLNTDIRLGDAICMHFHKSMWAELNKLWDDDNWLLEQIKSHHIINNHLNPNKILQKYIPNFISAGNAMILMKKYLSDSKLIFNPYDQYSSILLAAKALGKNYSYHQREDYLYDETDAIIKFFGLNCAQDAPGSNSAMMTELESWSQIEPIMNTFKCDKYLFILRDIGPYSNFVVDYYGDSYIILI